jgi:hypothetical protein
MDPGWDECPYCKVGGEGTVGAPSRRATVLETPPRGGTVPESGPSASIASPAFPAAPAPPAGSGGRRRTRFMPGADQGEGAAASSRPDARRIVALLVTYTWVPGGEVFPIREGRNYLGSDPDCEIRVRSDPQVSGRHATLIYRGKDFWIDDEKSMNGTYVDGEVVEQRRRLDNYAQLRTGATVWTFIAIQPPERA